MALGCSDADLLGLEVSAQYNLNECSVFLVSAARLLMFRVKRNFVLGRAFQ